MARAKTKKQQLTLDLSGNRTQTAIIKRGTATMAKKRKSSSRGYSGPTQIVMRESVSVAPRRGGPPARRSSSAAAVRPIYISSTQAVRGGGGGGGGRRRSSSRGGGSQAGARVRKGAAIAGVVIGYLDRPGSMAEATLAKVPALGGSRKITLALIAHMVAKKRPGGYIDHAATALTAIAAYDVGRNGLANLGLQGPGDTVARF